MNELEKRVYESKMDDFILFEEKLDRMNNLEIFYDLDDTLMIKKLGDDDFLFTVKTSDFREYENGFLLRGSKNNITFKYMNLVNTEQRRNNEQLRNEQMNALRNNDLNF